MIAVERLLSISGEDTLTIDLEYREPWTGSAEHAVPDHDQPDPALLRQLRRRRR